MGAPSMMTWLPSALQRPLLGIFMPINPARDIRPIALNLTADGSVVAAQAACNLSQTEFEQQEMVYNVTLF
jgi:hypothetical protein